jgi:hypothetical protein
MAGAVWSALHCALWVCVAFHYTHMSRAQTPPARQIASFGELDKLQQGGAFTLPTAIRIPTNATNVFVNGGPDTTLFCRTTCFLLSALTANFSLANVNIRMFADANATAAALADRAVIDFEANATHAALSSHPHLLRVGRVALLPPPTLPPQPVALVRFANAPHLASIVIDSVTGTFTRLLHGGPAGLLASLQLRSLVVNCTLDCVLFNTSAAAIAIDVFNSSIAMVADPAAAGAVVALSSSSASMLVSVAALASGSSSFSATRSSLANGAVALTNFDLVRFVNASLALPSVDLSGVLVLNLTQVALRPPLSRPGSDAPIGHAFDILLTASGNAQLILNGIDATGFGDAYGGVSLVHVAPQVVIDDITIADVDIDYFRTLLHVDSARVNGAITITNVRTKHTTVALLQMPRGSGLTSLSVENVAFSGRLVDNVIYVYHAINVVLRNISIASVSQPTRSLMTLDVMRRSVLLANITARNSSFDSFLNITALTSLLELTMQSVLIDRTRFARFVNIGTFGSTLSDVVVTDSGISDRLISSGGSLTLQNLRVERLAARRALVTVPIAQCQSLQNLTVVDTQISDAEPAINLDSTDNANFDCTLDRISFTGVRTAHAQLISAAVPSLKAKGRVTLANAAFVDNTGGTAFIVKANLPADAFSVTNVLARNVSSALLSVDAVGAVTLSNVNISTSSASSAVFINAFENATLGDVIVRGTVARVCGDAPIALIGGPIASVSFAQLLNNDVTACVGAASSGLLVVNVTDFRLSSSRFDSNTATNGSALVGRDVALGRVEMSDFLLNRCSGGTTCSGALMWSARSGATASSLNVSAARFAGNVGDSGGGAVLMNCNVTVNDTVFVANAASKGLGGALHASRADVTISHSVFDSGRALGSGAAISATLSVVRVRDSDVIGSVTSFTADVPITGGALAIVHAPGIRLQRVSVSGTRINGTSSKPGVPDCGALHLGVVANGSVLVDDVCACDASFGDGSVLVGVACMDAAMCDWKSTAPVVGVVSSNCPFPVVGARCNSEACPKRVPTYVRDFTTTTTRKTSAAPTAVIRSSTSMPTTIVGTTSASSSSSSSSSKSNNTSPSTELPVSGSSEVTAEPVPTWVWVVVGCAALVVVVAIVAICYVLYKRRQQQRRRRGMLNKERSLRHLGEEMKSAREEPMSTTSTQSFIAPATMSSVAMTTREYGRPGLVPQPEYTTVGGPSGSVAPSYASVAVVAPYDDVSSNLAVSGRSAMNRGGHDDFGQSGRSMLNRGGGHKHHDSGYATAHVHRPSGGGDSDGGGTVMSSSGRHRRHSGHGHHHGYASAKVKPPPTDYGYASGGGSVAGGGNGYATAHAVKPPQSEYDHAGLMRDSSRGSRGSRSSRGSRGSRGSLNGSAKAALKKKELLASDSAQV